MKFKPYYRILVLAVTAAVTALLFVGCADKWEEGKVRVMTSVFPYYDFARIVGGEYADGKILLKPGADSHGYEPTARQIANIQDADIFIYSGQSMESWADRVVKSLDGDVNIIDVSGYLASLHDHEDDHDHEEGEQLSAFGGNRVLPLHAGHDHDHDHEHGEDPHIWFCISDMIEAVEKIAAELAAIDIDNAQYYNDNAEQLVDELRELDQEYIERIAGAGEGKLIFTGHFAYGILLQNYGIDNYIRLYEGVSEDEEAKIGNRAAIMNELTGGSTKFLFYDYYDAKPEAGQLAKDAQNGGAKEITLLKIHSLENLSKADFEAEKTYVSLMRENLDNLVLALNG